MNSTLNRTRGTKRLASAALVIGSTVAVMASPLALGTASAVTAHTDSAVSIAPASQNQGRPTNTVATLNVNYTTSATFLTGDSVPSIYLSFLGGPDANAANTSPKGALCVTSNPANNTNTGTATCSIANTGTPGIDTVRVFADNGGTAAQNDQPTPDVQSATTTVTFSAAPDSVTLNPTNSTSATGTCVVYTVTAATNSPSQPAGNRLINIVVTEPPTTPGTDPITHYAVDTSVDPNGVCTTATAGRTFSVTTGNNGSVKFGISSSTVGTGSVTATSADNPSASAPSSATWTGGGADSVNNVVVAPTSTTDYVGTQEKFVVTVSNNGTPIQNVAVSQEITSGPDTLGASSCGLTDQNGKVTCQFTNGGGAGTDNLKYWVNNNLGCAHNTEQDSCEFGTTATATFQAQPTFNQHTLTCIDQLATNKGVASTTCNVPLSQHSVTFTENLKNSGTAVPNVIVSFTATGTIGGVAKTITGNATTDSNGNATFDVANPAPVNGDNVTVTTKVGPNATGDSASANWQAPVATKLAVNPPLQTVQTHGTVTVTAQVVDQFGTGVPTVHNLSWLVLGRNAGKSSPIGGVNTDGTGSVTITYTDTGSAGSDTIQVSDNTAPALSGSAKVDYVNGSTTAASVVIDTSGNGTTDPTPALASSCGASGHTPATGVALQAQTTVCAIVKNSGGEALAGKSVTFTVSNGQVDATTGTTATSTTTYVATTDDQGVAFAKVTSTKSGSQTVTAAADGVTNSSTVTYNAPTAAQARTVKIAPTPATITAGAQQKFTATVTDVFGNGVPGVTVTFTQSGPGSIGGQSSATLTTAADGTAAVTLTTVASDTGSGSVVSSIPNTGNQCTQPAGTPAGSTAGNCTATATYTVKTAVTPASLALQAAGAHKVGSQELIAATVTNSDGTPAANQVVRFKVTGANSATGSGVTTAKGVAFFAYTPTHAGTDHVSAYDDVDNNSTAGAGEPAGTLSVSIDSGKKEHPTVRLTSKHGKVTIHVTSHPSLSHARVTYYIQHLGRFHQIGSNRTGSGGHAHLTFHKKVGVQHTYRAKVTGKNGVKSGTSASRSIKTKA